MPKRNRVLRTAGLRFDSIRRYILRPPYTSEMLIKRGLHVAGTEVTSAQIERHVGDALVDVRLRGLVLIRAASSHNWKQSNMYHGD